jgi:signal transduction histidine kinase
MTKIYLFILILVVIFPFRSLQANEAERQLLLYKSSRVDTIQLEALRQLVNYWKGPGNNQDSLLYYARILADEAVAKEHYNRAFKGFYWLVSIYSQRGQSDSCLYYAFKAVKVFEKHNRDYGLAVMYTFIGEEYRASEQFDLALNYLHKSWEISKKARNKAIRTGTANRLAATYFEAKDKDKALQWADSSLIWGEKTNSYNYYIKNLTIIGAVKRDIGEFKEAKAYFYKALQACEDDSINRLNILSNLATLYTKIYINKPDSVIFYGQQAFSLARHYKIKSNEVLASQHLAEAYELKGEYKKAYEYLRNYEQVRHFIFFKERDAQIAELNTKFELSQKEKEIEAQKLKVNQKELKLRNRSITLVASISLSVLLVLFTLLLLRSSRKRKRTNELLQEINNQIETQKRDLERYSQETENAYEKLKDITEDKEALIHMVVHDLKNPLNNLVNIELYEEEKLKDKIVLQSANEMLNLVKNMLDISSSENRDLRLNIQEINPAEHLKKCIQQVAYLAKPKKIKIELIISHNSTLQADPDAFDRICNNLLTNSIKYSDVDSTIQVSLSKKEENILQLEVSDTGQGIAPEHHKLIFEKYGQVKLKGRNYSGSTGLGLAFCKLACEAHAWAIDVDSNLGKGATFLIQIPLNENPNQSPSD